MNAANSQARLKHSSLVAGTPCVNCLSIDVEGFVESSIESVPLNAAAIDARREAVEVERNVAVLLELLADAGIRGTWFFLGRIGRDLPGVVRRVVAAGHELACHSFHHRRLFNMRPADVRKVLVEARAVLEDAGGTRVWGFRAPDFSVTRASYWALDAIQAAGFVYDSSIVPTRLHDVYGMPGADPGIHRLPNGLIEFPPATAKLGGHRVPFGGGAWFRFHPIWLTRLLIRRANRAQQSCMLYLHPYEVGPELSWIPMSWLRRIRHYHNCGKPERLRRMVNSFAFAPAIEILRALGYVP